MSGQITWQEIREQVARLHEALDSSHGRAREAVLNPADSVPDGTEYRAAFAQLLWDMDVLQGMAERLLEQLAESTPPARPLEAVLAEIVALGHQYVTVDISGQRARCTSYRTHDGMPAAPSAHDYDPASWERWDAEVERGAVSAEDPTAAAEARLDQIRELHTAKWVTSLFDGPRLLANLTGDPTFNPVTGATTVARYVAREREDGRFEVRNLHGYDEPIVGVYDEEEAGRQRDLLNGAPEEPFCG